MKIKEIIIIIFLITYSGCVPKMYPPDIGEVEDGDKDDNKPKPYCGEKSDWIIELKEDSIMYENIEISYPLFLDKETWFSIPCSDSFGRPYTELDQFAGHAQINLYWIWVATLEDVKHPIILNIEIVYEPAKNQVYIDLESQKKGLSISYNGYQYILLWNLDCTASLSSKDLPECVNSNEKYYMELSMIKKPTK